MCTMLYPEFMVAVDVNNAIHRRMRMDRKDGRKHIKGSDMKAILDRIRISPEGCVERQGRFKVAGLANVFIGYESIDWNAEDYRNYLDEHPDIFEKDSENEGVYCLKKKKSITDYAEYGRNESAYDFSIKFCQRMLMWAYSPGVMKKFGLR